MSEHFYELVESIRRKLVSNNHSDVRVRIDYHYELVYFKIDKKFSLVYTFEQVYEYNDGVIKWQ